MSSKSTFSYAQAAKGFSGPPAPSKAASTDTEKSEPKLEEQSNNAPTESVTTASESDTPRDTEKATVNSSEEAEFTTVTSKHAARSKATHSRTSSPSVGPRLTAEKSKEGDSSNATNGTTEASSEKQSKADGKAEKSEDSSENSKDKAEKPEKSEKSEKKEKEPPKELKAAPLPSVNIWQQRKEAQEAKAKTAPAAAPGTAGKTGAGKTEEPQQETLKTSSKKKGADGTPEGTKDRKKTEGGKGREDAPPAVGDATLWPTPQVALGEEKKKAQEKSADKAADKAERSDKSPVIRPHGKEKWMPVNYVPTAVFNTPLPSSGRGGRRATRGGRDGGRGGAHGAGTASGEKSASGHASQGPVKQAGERGRNEAGNGRATSLPAQSRRSTSTDVTTSEGRKPQAMERGRGARADDANLPNGKQANGGEHFTRPQRDGKQYAKNQNGQAGDRNSRAAHLAVDSQAAARTNDRRTESGSKSADPSGFQDFNRERGGRSNRGRGGFSPFGGQNAHFGNMPNNSFVNPKSFGFNDRQRSQHGLPNGTQQGNRIPMRSPSLPASAGMYGVYPFPSDINTMYGYQAVAPGPMSAISYQQYMEPFSLMSMLSMQLEYYFSVDNMCKDMFLRRHMDSQGFVPLGVIASFKRVKSLTEDFELLRHVSRQLRNVEYQTGEDGVDRLRPRENWAQWVLPVDQRDASAQHEGAPPVKHAGKINENVPASNNHADGVPNGSMNGPREFIPNGTASRASRTPLSSTAPEFMPSMPPTAQNEISNVGHPADLISSPRGSPTMDPPSAIPFGESHVDDDHPARGLSLHRPKRRSPWTAGRFTGSDLNDKQCRSTSFGARFSANPPLPPYHLPSEYGGAGPPQHKKFIHVRNLSTEMFRKHAFGVQDPRVTPKHGLEMGPPYRSWSQYLSRDFNLQLYNEFRRLAIDELFTRHNDYGFNALMDFYRACLLCKRRLPDEVISDMVHLSRAESSNVHVRVHELLTSIIDGNQMEISNRKKARHYLNIEFGYVVRRRDNSPH